MDPLFQIGLLTEIPALQDAKSCYGCRRLMRRFFASRRWWAKTLASGIFVFTLNGYAQEFRGFWVDAFHDGFRSAAQVSQLMADVRAARCNAVIVEVRKRGDAYYQSLFEPRATDIVGAEYDPLQDLIDKAHDTSAGQRIEVHAWIVTYPIWGSQTEAPSQPTHPYNLHPDWLSQDINGNRWASAYYVFDPGHPEVQQHTFNVALDIITRYDVDGLNFDYIRYPGYTWGYHPVAVARFNAEHGHSGLPSPTDASWRQWRRNQVTALLRKVYLSALAVKPHVKISADTITWAPSVTTDTAWTNSARAYNEVLQDWRGWMEEGILDLNIPMSYFRQADPVRAQNYLEWNLFAKDRRFNRHVVIGPGLYLNSISNGIHQMRLTREATPSGNRADGVCGYSYAVPASNSIPNLRAAFLEALIQPTVHDPDPVPIFPTTATIPSMPWKTAPTVGHVKGIVRSTLTGQTFDGASVDLAGPAGKGMRTDATGFYGAVDLEPGLYTLTASANGHGTVRTNFTVVAGVVSTIDLTLPPQAPTITSHPQSQWANVGDTARFNIMVAAAEPWGCYWTKDGVIVPDSGSTTLTLNNVQVAQAGVYAAVVTNAWGTAVSLSATLTVGLPFLNLTVRPGAFGAIISWSTTVPVAGQVNYGPTPGLGTTTLSAASATEHSVLLTGLSPNTAYYFRAIQRAGTNDYRSSMQTFRTAGDIILDNPDAVYDGVWSIGTSAPGRYLDDYHYSSTVSSGTIPRTARYTPTISTPGYYDVFVWYAQGGNRSADAPFTVSHEGGSMTVHVNQQTDGGSWQLIAERKLFRAGTSGYVELANNTGEANKVVIADAVRFAYSPGQEPPVAGTVPRWWEEYYFGSSVDAALDHDNDGYSTWTEFNLGTVPTNAASRLVFSLKQHSALRAAFSPYLPDRHYSLEASSNLDAGAWQTLTNVPLEILPDGSARLVIPLPAGNQTFYRLKADWAP